MTASHPQIRKAVPSLFILFIHVSKSSSKNRNQAVGCSDIFQIIRNRHPHSPQENSSKSRLKLIPNQIRPRHSPAIKVLFFEFRKYLIEATVTASTNATGMIDSNKGRSLECNGEITKEMIKTNAQIMIP